ncbi:MAG: serine protease [Actinomycetota bacterium]
MTIQTPKNPNDRRHVGSRLLRLLLAALLSGLAVAVAAGPSAAVPTAEPLPELRAARYTEPAIVLIQVDWSGFIDYGGRDRYAVEASVTCSGFTVNPNGYIVTAGHCADPGMGIGGGGRLLLDRAVKELWPQLSEQFASVDDLTDHALAHWEVEGAEAGSRPRPEIQVVQGAALGALDSATARPARTIDVQPWEEGDIALLKVEQSGLPTIPLADGRSVDIGTPVQAVGFPGSVDRVVDPDLDPTFTLGSISSLTTNRTFTVFGLSAAMSGGMSGGPVVDQAGRVIGVNSFGTDPQAFNFASSVDLVAEMLRRNGVEAIDGPTDAAYRAAVDAFLTNRFDEALANVQLVLDRIPNHPQATELRIDIVEAAGDAQPAVVPPVETVESQPAPSISPIPAAPVTPAAPAAPADGPWTPTPIVLIGSIVALVALVGLFLAVRSLRSADQSVQPARRPAPAPARTTDGAQWWDAGMPTDDQTGWWADIPTTSNRNNGPRVDA